VLSKVFQAQAAGMGAPVDDPAALVVFAGAMTPQTLQRRVSGYRNVPGIQGFSVQSAPHKTLEELVAAGGLGRRALSVTTVGALQEAGQSVGLQIEVVRAPGRGFHSIVVTPPALSTPAAQVLSKVFRGRPNPSL
jgi:hypothetical protein